ncbi:MAG: outer membrane beta-barrel protein [Pseudomonadota bacterium]
MLRILTCAALLLTSTAHADALLDEARQLLDARAGEQAYQLLAPQEDTRAGEVEYDYLLGLAALQSNRTTRAVFALERVLSVQPDHSQARAELARAYFLIGENQAAHHEFSQVLRQDPPETVRNSIARYLNVLEQRFDAQLDQLSGYLELGVGHDSNVNSATSDSQVAIPALGNLVFTLDPGGLEQSDSFASVRGGLNYRRQLRPDLQAFVGGNVEDRRNADYDRFNIGTADAHAGLRLQSGRERYIAALQTQGLWLDGERYRTLAGLNLQWEHIFDARNQGSLFMQYAAQHYPEQQTRDVNTTMIGAAWVHALKQTTAPVVFYSSLFGGTDDEQDGNYRHIGRDFWGLRLGVNYALSQKIGFNLLGSYQAASYGADDPLFLRTRRDDLYDASLTATYKATKDWSWRAQLRHSKNDSNIPITQYERTQMMLSLRRDFR